MKTRDLERQLNDLGYYLIRNSSHKIFSNGIISIPMPHHTEINPFLAKKIIRQAEKCMRQLEKTVA